MRKILPLIMVVSFWSIFYWGLNYPKVGDIILVIGIIGFTIIIISLIRKLVRFLIETTN